MQVGVGGRLAGAGERGDNVRGVSEAGRPEGGRTGRENTEPLGGDVPEYGTGCIRRGERTDNYPFWDIKYPERTERRFGVGVERYGTIKCGCRGIPGNKTDRRHIHPGIGRIKGRRDADTKPAPRQRHALLPGPPAFSVEAILQFSANVIACQLTMGERCWYLSRAAGGRSVGGENTGPLGGDVPENGT